MKSRKIILPILLLGFLAACTRVNTYRISEPAIDPGIIAQANAHTISVVTIYAMSEEEWQRRVEARQAGAFRGDPTLFVPLNAQVTDQDGKPIKFLAYIGSATIIADNHAISVSHLFSQEAGTYGYKTFAFKDGMDHAVECDLVAKGDIEADWCNDYAVVRLREDLGLPGLKIATAAPKEGDLVIYSGSVGGLAFFTRFDTLQIIRGYFEVGQDGQLHLKLFGPDWFWVIHESGPGDSGGSIKNLKGEIIGIMYVGISVYQSQWVFSNQQFYLWQFLKANGLEYLAQ